MKYLALICTFLIAFPSFALEPQAAHSTKRGSHTIDWSCTAHTKVAKPDTPRIVRTVQQNDQAATSILMQGAEQQAGDAALNALLKRKGDIAYGEYLAGQCTTCHNAGVSQQVGDGIPVIAGKQRNAILSALYAYRMGKRKSEVMQQIASTLGEEEMAALAEYFSRLD